MMGKTVDAIGRRNDELRQVTRYARGGVMPVMGIGSGTSDSIPVVVAGQKVRLSNGEGAAILPAKTMKTPGAVDAVESIIEATNGKPAETRGRNDDGLACGGVKGKRMAGGGVLDPEEQKRQMTNYVVPTPAPTAQEVYSGVDAKGLATAAFPSTMSAIQKYGDAADAAAKQGNYGGAVGQALRGGVAGTVGVANDVMRSGAALLDPAANALKTFVTGDSSPINSPQQQGVTTPQGMQQASYSNEGRPSALNAAINPDFLRGNPGDARFNAQNGVLSFTDKNFDPTQQQFAPGTGAITDPKTGRTMLLTAGVADNPASGAATQAAPGGMAVRRDAYGNSTAITQQLQGQLADQRAEQAKAQADWNRQNAGRPSYDQQRMAEADRFTQFVNESDAARLAHDLGTGGGTARTNAGKIAALHEMQNANAAARSMQTARDLAAVHGANQLAVADAQGQNQLSMTAAQGGNQLANTALSGQNQLAVENAKQSEPEKALKIVQAQGQIEDTNAQRAARNGLFSAIDSGDKAATDLAQRKAIAAGVLKSEKPANSYRIVTDPMGQQTRIDESTGMSDVLDRTTNTWKPVRAIQGSTPPQDALDALKKNPKLATEFQQKYGSLPQ